MKVIYLVLAVLSVLNLNDREPANNDWIIEIHKDYTLFFRETDRINIKEYNKLLEKGIIKVKEFFGSSYKKSFDIMIHPDRHSLDSTWQKEFNIPGFKSECWMVAGGYASKMDMISPVMWKKEACEHIYTETNKTQKLITHELVHVYHGQLNVSPDFSITEGIDWFIEGLATYASGQLDSVKLGEVKKAISENKIPLKIDDYWTGKLRYSLSGSVVMFIDKKYGREILKELLRFNKKSEILTSLNASESELINNWKTFMMNL